MTLSGKHAFDRRYQFRAIQSQPNLLQSVNKNILLAEYKQTADIRLLKSNSGTNKQSMRPKTAQAGLHSSFHSHPNTAAASRYEQDSQSSGVKERPNSGVLRRQHSYDMSQELKKNSNHQSRPLLR